MMQIRGAEHGGFDQHSDKASPDMEPDDSSSVIELEADLDEMCKDGLEEMRNYEKVPAHLLPAPSSHGAIY